MTQIKHFFGLLLFFIGAIAYAQEGASSCAELEANYQLYQSCATNIPFQNSTGANAEVFTSTCIPEPFRGPTWFFLEVQTPGSIILQISQVNSANIGTDVDFILWGPFNTLNNICSQLVPSNEVDCSWAPDSVETVTLPNGVAGQLYVLLIDNYSNQPGNISITQIGGTGSSNCDFLSSVEILDSTLNEITQLDYCKPDSKDLVARIDVNDFPGTPANLRFNYKWFKDGNLISTITASTSNTNTFTVTDSGVYKVETTAYDSTDPSVVIDNLIVSSDEITLKFHTTPTVSISNTNTTCLSSNPELQAVISNQASLNPAIDLLSYQWYRNSTLVTGATSPNFTPTLPGDYFVRISNAPCSVAESNSIRIIANPQVQIDSNQIICENSTYTITSNLTNSSLLSSVTYQWFKDGTLISGATNSTYTVSGLNQNLNTTASYTLEVTEQNACMTPSNPVAITVNALPVVTTTPILLEQCDFISPTLDGIATTDLSQVYNQITNNVGGLTLYYYQDAALTLPILNFQAYTNTSSAFTQDIYVKAVNETVVPNCPSQNTAVIRLVINPTSVATYPNMAPVCPELNASFGYIDFTAQRTIIKNNYFPVTNVEIGFYLTPTDASLGTNPLSNTSQIPVGVHTIYTRVTTNSNCSAIGVFQIEVHQAPLQTPISRTPLCSEDVFLLNTKDTEALTGQTPTTQASYFNSFDNAKNNINPINKNTVLPLTVGTQEIFIRLFDAATQCFSVVSFYLDVFPVPTITNPQPLQACGTTTADFNLNFSIPSIIGNNTGYLVTFYETNSDVITDNPIQTPGNYNSGNRTLIVKVTDPANNNCNKTTTLTLQLLSPPGANSNPTPIERCNDSGISTFNLRLREGEMSGATAQNDINFKYYSDLTDALANNGNTITTPMAFRNTTPFYQRLYVRLNSKRNFNSETGEACYRILELDLYVRTLPTNNIGTEPYIICIDKDSNPVRPAIIDTELTTGRYTFVWYNDFNAPAGNEIPGETSSVFTTLTAGNYSVKITDTSNAARCDRIVNFVTQNSFVPFSVTGQPDELIAFDLASTITAIAFPSSADYLYSIDNGPWQTSNVFTHVPNGEHTITVSNKYNCGEVSTTVVVVDYPKFFTPNGDNHNDFWNIGGVEALDSIEILIFDRYGKLIKQLNPYGLGWDGTFNGNPMPSTDYWFKLTYQNNGIEKEFAGHFSLKR